MTRPSDQTRLCLAYAAGPGDVVSTFQHWQRGEDDPHQLAMTYSGQFFDVCRSLGARGVVVSSNPRAARVETQDFWVENLPKGPTRSGLGFHLQQAGYVRQVLGRAAAQGADLLVAADASGHFFPLAWHAPRHMGLVPSLHCTLWPKFSGVSKAQAAVNRLNRNLFRNRAAAILCLSQDIRSQVETVSGNAPRPVFPFIPTYRRSVFEHVPEPPAGGLFNLLFAGRMETEKGIFDLLRMAVDLKQAGHSHIHIHLCGDGSREADLRREAARAGVEGTFHIHGYCRRPEMQTRIARSHALIVPTTTAFGEGLNKVVVEGVLAGRPVITSSVCPALGLVADAVVESPPDDPAGYFRAALLLASDPGLYAARRTACTRLQEQFYDPERSWGRALLRAVERWSHDRQPSR